MDEANRSAEIVRFGSFEVDLRAGELRCNGAKVKLQEQPFQIVRLLLERPGEAVTREELRTRLWPADTFVDFDHGLNAAVRRLRDALGDDADNPRFVETLPRRGYRFIAPVTSDGDKASAAAFPQPSGGGGMSASPFADLNALAAHLRAELATKKFTLLYAYNGTGKTRLALQGMFLC